jgi:hypothetical protein
VQFAANKKWAMSPLLSPPAGVHTDKTLSDKFVCTARIPRIAGKFNGRSDFERLAIPGGHGLDSNRTSTGFHFLRPLACLLHNRQRSSISRSPHEIPKNRRSRPRLLVSEPANQAEPTKREAAFVLVEYSAQRSDRKPAHSKEQSLPDRPSITLVCMKHVTSARLFAAKVVPNLLDLFCAASTQARQ